MNPSSWHTELDNLYAGGRPDEHVLDASAHMLSRRADEARGELLRADSKAATLLTLATGGLALVVALVTSGRVPDGAVTALLWAGAFPIALAVLFLLKVLRPRYRLTRVGPADRMESPAALIAKSRASAPLPEREEALRLAELSELAHYKHRWIRRAVDALATGLVMLGIAAAIGCLT